VPTAEAAPEPMQAEQLASLQEADAKKDTGKMKAVVPESEDDIEIDETIEDDDRDDEGLPTWKKATGRHRHPGNEET
jgi:uncharacterized protein (TIGR02300 family)